MLEQNASNDQHVTAYVACDYAYVASENQPYCSDLLQLDTCKINKWKFTFSWMIRGSPRYGPNLPDGCEISYLFWPILGDFRVDLDVYRLFLVESADNFLGDPFLGAEQEFPFGKIGDLLDFDMLAYIDLHVHDYDHRGFIPASVVLLQIELFKLVIHVGHNILT